MDGSGYASRARVSAAAQDMAQLRLMVIEHAEQKRTIRDLEAALNDERTAMAKLQAESDELQKGSMRQKSRASSCARLRAAQRRSRAAVPLYFQRTWSIQSQRCFLRS